MCRYLTSNDNLLNILFAGATMFWLDIFALWEDLILYKQENKIVVKKSVWSDKLCPGRSGEFFQMKLTDIQHVGISNELDLFILYGKGKTVAISTKGLTIEEMQYIKREINYFLNMSRLKYLDYTSIDPSERVLLTSDSEEEYLQNLSGTCLPMSNELTASDNTLGSAKVCRSQIQQNLSFPSLASEIQLGRYQLMNLRKGPYTENSTHKKLVSASRNFSKLNKERS